MGVGVKDFVEAGAGVEKYAEIIDLPHHVSRVHRPMKREMRAAQFGAFAALEGYAEVLEETAEGVVLDGGSVLSEEDGVLDEGGVFVE